MFFAVLPWQAYLVFTPILPLWVRWASGRRQISHMVLPGFMIAVIFYYSSGAGVFTGSRKARSAIEPLEILLSGRQTRAPVPMGWIDFKHTLVHSHSSGGITWLDLTITY